MKYAKLPLPVEKQIKLLESRGMVIPDHARAIRYFSNINYYRLRAYWVPFEEATPATGNHKFKAGTTFDDVLTLYIFDRKFRLLVWEAIERVEVSFRTRFVDVLAIKHGSHPHTNPGLFYNPATYQELFSTLQEEIDRSNETFIEHYVTKYTNPALPPIWAVCEIMSFGQISQWFSNLKLIQDRKDIASAYSLHESVLRSFMRHLSHVRNLIAHHCRLWNRKFVVTMTIPNYPTSLATTMNVGEIRRIYNTLAMLAYLMRVISPGTSWPVRLRRLLEEYPAVDPYAMGFPANWRDLPVWAVKP